MIYFSVLFRNHELDGGMEVHLPSGRSCSHLLHYLSGQSSSNNFIESKFYKITTNFRTHQNRPIWSVGLI